MAVLRKHGRVVWHEIKLPMLGEIGSTGTYPLSRHHGTEWMRTHPTVTGAWLDYHGGDALESTSLLSTGSIHASLLIERTDPNGPPGSRRRYYRYLFARTIDGRVHQAGPDKDVADGHHQAQRPAHLDKLYSLSTSTGW